MGTDKVLATPMAEMNRRGFLIGAGAVLAAPAIVRYENIMPVRNRLLIPFVPMTFSCYLKPGENTTLTNSVGSLTPIGKGWFRYVVTQDVANGVGGEITVPLPISTVWGCQLEWDGKGLLVNPGKPYSVKIE